MNIAIEKNRYGSLFALDAETCNLLFQFEYRRKDMGGPAWYFWLRGNYNPYIFNGKKKLEAACEKALSYTSQPSYKGVKNILLNMKDEPPKDGKDVNDELMIRLGMLV